VALATVATLSQNVFEAPRDEGGISRSIPTSERASMGFGYTSTPEDVDDQFKTQAHTRRQWLPAYKATLRGYEPLTEELDGLDEHTFAAVLDKRPTPDKAHDQFIKKVKNEISASAQKQSLPYPAPSSLSLKWPTAVKVSTSPSSHRPGFRGLSESIPIVRLNNLAYTKLIVHAIQHPQKIVNGLLLGQRPAPDAPIDIVDAVPLQHHQINLEPVIKAGLGMVRSSSPHLLLSVTSLNYVILSPPFLCEIDYRLRPQSPAPCSWTLRGTRALLYHGVIPSRRANRGQD